MCVSYLVQSLITKKNKTKQKNLNNTVIQGLPLVSKGGYYSIDHSSAPRQWTAPMQATHQLRSKT